MLFVISFLVNHVMVIDWRLTTHHYPDSSIPYCCNGNSNKMCQNAYTFSPIILSHQSCPFLGTLWFSIHPFLFISFGRDASNVPHVLTVTARCGVPFVYHVTGDMSLQQLHPRQQIQINHVLLPSACIIITLPCTYPADEYTLIFIEDTTGIKSYAQFCSVRVIIDRFLSGSPSPS